MVFFNEQEKENLHQALDQRITTFQERITELQADPELYDAFITKVAPQPQSTAFVDEDSVNFLNQEISNLTERNAELEQALGDARTRLDDIEPVLEESEKNLEEIDRLNDNLVQAATRINSLEAERNQLRDSHGDTENLEATIKELTKNNNNLAEVIDQLNAENTELVNALDASKDGLTGVYDTFTQYVAVFLRDIPELNDENVIGYTFHRDGETRHFVKDTTGEALSFFELTNVLLTCVACFVEVSDEETETTDEVTGRHHEPNETNNDEVGLDDLDLNNDNDVDSI